MHTGNQYTRNPVAQESSVRPIRKFCMIMAESNPQGVLVFHPWSPQRQLINPAHSCGPSLYFIFKEIDGPLKTKWIPSLFYSSLTVFSCCLFFAASNVVLISLRVLFFSLISFWALPVHYSSLSAVLSFCLSTFSSPRNAPISKAHLFFIVPSDSVFPPLLLKALIPR